MVTVTRQIRRDAVRRTISMAGYGPALVVENFPVWQPRSHTDHVEFVAFVAPDQHDMTTAAILGAVVDDERELHERWLPLASALAAPAAVIAWPDSLALWRVGSTHDSSEELVRAPIGSNTAVIDRLSHLSPDAVRRWKSGGLQLPLFPVDVRLLERSSGLAQTTLTNLVERALLDVRDKLPKAKAELHVKIVIAALAVLMIRDKGRPNELVGGGLVDIAQNRFPSYFGWITNLNDAERRAVDSLVMNLGTQVNFAALAPTMVSEVYEQALMNAAQRRAQGAFYTPPRLARRMLDALPLEDLPPDRRYILDPTCGSGTLLLAAASRLDDLNSATTDAVGRHQFVVSHLRGYDQDSFAVEISRLVLLMTALPIGNSWHISTRDVLKANLSESERPGAIVSNPPWAYSREAGRQTERATTFLRWMIDNLRPGGLLACVLPVSWLNSRTSASSRQQLLESCSLLDVWELPEQTFGTSAAAPTVLIARKDEPEALRRNRLTLVKRITARHGELGRFLDTGFASATTLAKADSSGSGILSGPIASYLRSQPDLQPLTNIAVVQSGSAHKPGRAARPSNLATHLELASAERLDAFGIVDAVSLMPVNYPDDFHRTSRSDKLVRSKKVLTSAKRASGSAWRVKNGLDLIGVVARESMYMIVGKDWDGWKELSEVDRLYGLLAVTGSALFSAWIQELEPKRNISSSVYKTFPVPRSSEAWWLLSAAGRGMADATQTGDRRKLNAAGIRLEQAVATAYSLDDTIVRLLATIFAGTESPDGSVRYPSTNLEAKGVDLSEDRMQPMSSFGTVLDAGLDGLRLWVAGITDDEGVKIAAPRRGLGWMCRPNADFVVLGDLSRLEDAEFRLHDYEWLGQDGDIAFPGEPDGE